MTRAPSPPRPFLRTTGWVLVLGSVAAVLAVTLWPSSPQHSLGGLSLCFICGEFGLANLLRNVVLFVPLGVGLGLIGRSPLRAWLPTVLLSGAIELTQVMIPGRNPLLIDWLANSFGGGVGVALAGSIRHRLGVSVSGTGAGRTMWWPAGISVVLAAGVLVGSAWAFRVTAPDPPHHIQWTPRLAQFDAYGGRILGASLAGSTLPVGPHQEPEALEAALLGGDTLTVDFVAGPPPRRLAPIFSIFTGARHELLVLGARGDDVVLRLPLEAARLRLDRPELVVAGALTGAREGANLRMTFRLLDDGACVYVQMRDSDPESPELQGACGLRPTLGQGWSLLLFPRTLAAGWNPPGWQNGLSLLWLMGLGMIPGFFMASVRRAAGLGLVLAGVAAAAPSLAASVAWAPPLELGVLLLGAVAGHAAAVVSRPRSLQPCNTGEGDAPAARRGEDPGVREGDVFRGI